MERTTCKERLAELAQKLSLAPRLNRKTTTELKNQNVNAPQDAGSDQRNRSKATEHKAIAISRMAGSRGLKAHSHLDPDVVDLRCLLTQTGKRIYFERPAGAGTLRQIVEEFSKQPLRLSLDNFLEWVRENSHLRPFHPNENPTVGVIHEELVWEFEE